VKEEKMAGLRENASDRLLRSGVELSVDRYEMAQRARVDGAPEDGFTQESSVLLLTGWVSGLKLWLARRIRPRRKAVRQSW
jgi:hypothetical protein